MLSSGLAALIGWPVGAWLATAAADASTDKPLSAILNNGVPARLPGGGMDPAVMACRKTTVRHLPDNHGIHGTRPYGDELGPLRC